MKPTMAPVAARCATNQPLTRAPAARVPGDLTEGGQPACVDAGGDQDRAGSVEAVRKPVLGFGQYPRRPRDLAGDQTHARELAPARSGLPVRRLGGIEAPDDVRDRVGPAALLIGATFGQQRVVRPPPVVEAADLVGGE